MSKLSLIFPIGGTGERFKKAGFKEPKPLVPLYGKPIFLHVLECYPKDADYFIIARKEFSKELCEVTEKAIITIDHITKGPSETILFLSERILKSLGEILVADCDSLISPTELMSAVEVFRASKGSGGVTTRLTEDPACSFAKIEDGWVIETREKDPFTKYSTTGPYWWKSGALLYEAIVWGMKQGQYHISPCYNYLIQQGMGVKAFPVSSFIHLGTPEALQIYEKAMALNER